MPTLSSEQLDKALCHFARAYADQTEADPAALKRAVARGDLPVEYSEHGEGGSAFRP